MNEIRIYYGSVWVNKSAGQKRGVLILPYQTGLKSILYCLVIAVVLLLPVYSPGQQSPSAKPLQQEKLENKAENQKAEKVQKKETVAPKVADYSKDIRRKGKTIIVRRSLVDKIRADNNIIMATVTVKGSVDKTGKGNGFKIVAVDKGSLVQKLGVIPNDIVQEVNGFKLTSSEDIDKADAALKNSKKFKVKVLRKGRPKTLYYEIR